MSLDESQDVLPATARTFQGWDVGLLERFDVGEEVLGEQDGADEFMGETEGLGPGYETGEERGRRGRRSLSMESVD